MRKKILSILLVALAVVTIGVIDARADGASDYATYCQMCHGPLASSTITGTTVAAVRAAVTSFGMASSGSLTDAQIQAILDAVHGTAAPAACTGYTYSAWAACDTTGQQTRTVTGSTPSGCTGTPVTTQICNYVPPPTTPTACTYTYSDWAACDTTGQQTRTVTGSTPSGCTGTPVTTQICSYVPPSSGMPMPVRKNIFPYPPISTPVTGMDPAQTMPIGLGAVAQGGDTLTVQAAFSQFLSPMDVYAAYGISTKPDRLFVLRSDNSVQAFSYSEIIQAIATGVLPAGADPWKIGTMGPINEVIENNVPISQLSPGTYTFYLLTTPAGSLANFYLWKTSFDVAGIDGTTLYAQNCSGCHGNIASSTKLGASAYEIQTGISSNAGGSMGGLTYLTTEQIEAIADALIGEIPPAPMPTGKSTYSYPPTDFPVVDADPSKARPLGVGPVAQGGDSVYVQLSLGRFVSPIDVYLAYNVPTDSRSLHVMKADNSIQVYPYQDLLMAASVGALPSGILPWKKGVVGPVDELLFDAPMSEVPAGVYSLYVMVTAANDPSTYYLWETQFGTSKAPDGTSLYAQYCAGCHGVLTKSEKAGASLSAISAGISSVSAMSGLKTLTADQVKAIATVLGQQTAPPPPASVPPTTITDGAALYASYCASCHGAIATSSKKGRTAAQIQSAINANTGGMGSRRSLTSAQISAIATALAGTTTTPPPTTTTDGATLYASYCASCHGALASSSKKGRTASQISSAISSVGSMNGISLTSAQISSIATALVGTTTTPPPTTTSGATLYASYCASCHGALASSSKKGRTALQISSAISSVGSMNGISLTSAQISSIATALVGTTTTPPPTTSNHPSNWYTAHRNYAENNGTSSCTSCHGANLRGGTGPSCYSCHGKTW